MMTKNSFIFANLPFVRIATFLILMFACLGAKAQVLEPLGSGLPSKVTAAYASGQDYLALFSDETTQDTSDYIVARWNGAYWSYFPGLYKPEAVKTIDGQYTFNSLALYRDTLYVGAYISGAKQDAAMPVSHLYKWNGEKWITDNSVVKSKNDGIVAMTVFDDKLVVAGKFLDVINGNLVNNIAIYDGAKGQWGFLGSSNTSQGSDGVIRALQVLGNRLYIAGDFQNFAGTFTGNIAYYTASNQTWGGIGSPFADRVEQLAVFSDKLAALGINTGKSEIREFDGNWSQALGLDTFSRAGFSTIAGSGNTLLVGGDFLYNGNGSSVLGYENGRFKTTGNRIQGTFALGQRGSEAFIWGDFTEQNTGLKRICKIENNAGDIAGLVFYDKNQNCLYDGADLPLGMRTIRFSNIKTGKMWFAVTDDKGKFAAALPEDDYNIQVFSGRHWVNSCPGNFASSVKKGEYSMVYLSQYMAPNVSDVEVKTEVIVSGAIRPGDDVKAVITLKNSGNTVINGPTLHLLHDARLTSFTADSAPDNYSGTEAIWSITRFEPGSTRNIPFTFKIPSDAQSTDRFPVYLKTGTAFTSADAYKGDNTDTLQLKLMDNGTAAVSKSSLKGDDVDFRVRELTYHVNFTNTSKGFVKRLVMLDTVDVNLPMSRVVITNLYPTDALVRTEKGNILVVEFPNANLAALESNPAAASGFITYKIELTADLKTGQYFYNRANGDFDSRWKASSNMVTVLAKNPFASVKRTVENPIKLWPNPVSNQLNLVFPIHTEGIAEITDNSGKVLLRKAISGKEMQCDVTALKPGMYFLKTPAGISGFQVNH
ncbi:MAG: T9SS type A sorting domain-containing protein [Sphingomonadales bacterium]|nr:T9SS type A sorting domain-containing protein [Sphingomonadales bacterium]